MKLKKAHRDSAHVCAACRTPIAPGERHWHEASGANTDRFHRACIPPGYEEARS